MKELTFEEYRQWLDKNKNKEEAMAEEVIKAILWEQVDSRWIATDYEPYFIPRKVINIDDRRLEFDLIIHLKDVTDRDKNIKYDKWIAVEFKETDLKKVVRQAILRRWYVDYMYIATMPIPATPEELVLMAYTHIGWVVWDKNKNVAFVAMRSYKRYTDRLNDFLFTLVETRLSEVVHYTIDRVSAKQFKTKTLWDYLEEEGEV